MTTKLCTSCQQALLNKRRLRCRGPPFLRLYETMRFVKQMLSAVRHLLDHGVAHNDIKPGRRQRGVLVAHPPQCPSNLSLFKRRDTLFLSWRIRVSTWRTVWLLRLEAAACDLLIPHARFVPCGFCSPPPPCPLAHLRSTRR